MYSYSISEKLKKILRKVSKKDKKSYEQILKEINKIINSDPEHYKNLRRPLQHLKRVHIGSFVLVFSFNKSKKEICFENYKHHDEIYKTSSYFSN